MSKLDKNFKSEIDRDFRECDYVGRKIGIRILLGVVIIAIIGIIGNTYIKRYKVEQDNITFKQSTTYNEGVLDDLAKYKYEMIKAKDNIEKAAIAQLVNSRYANFDESKIENKDLKQFLKDCRNGKY